MKKWLENYWYHYKWHTIIGIAVIILVAVLIAQLIGKVNYDALFMYVGNDDISATEHSEIVKSLEKVCGDTTENGKIEINFSRTAYVADISSATDAQINASGADFLSTMLHQPYYIYFIRKDAYEQHKDAFVPLSDIFGENIPDSAYDDKGILFSKTDFCGSNSVYGCLSDDVVIALKEKPYIFSIFGGQKKAEEKSFLAHLEIFKAIVLYEK